MPESSIPAWRGRGGEGGDFAGVDERGLPLLSSPRSSSFHGWFILLYSHYISKYSKLSTQIKMQKESHTPLVFPSDVWLLIVFGDCLGVMSISESWNRRLHWLLSLILMSVWSISGLISLSACPSALRGQLREGLACSQSGIFGSPLPSPSHFRCIGTFWNLSGSSSAKHTQIMLDSEWWGKY